MSAATLIDRSLPFAGAVGGRGSAVARVTTAALVGVWGLYLLLVVAGTGLGIHEFAKTYVFGGLPLVAAAVCLLRAAFDAHERASWALIGFGMILWAGGSVYWSVALTDLDAPPYPSPADLLYVGFYPACYVALMLLAGPRVRGIGASVWLDGLIAMLAVGAVGAALFLPHVAVPSSDPAALATNLAYPLGDLLLIALVVGGFALTSWRPGRAWALIGAGLVLFAVADSLYLYLVAQGAFVEGSWLDAIWPAGMVLLAVAAWQTPSRPDPPRADALPVLAIPVPLALTLASVGVLAYGNLASINDAALLLAGATVVAAMARLVLSFRQIRTHADTRRLATTDELTGLRNRRYLYEQLRRELAIARAEGTPMTLLIADLDGFKELNDTLGHHTGDLLLQQLGPRVLDALRECDTLARLGGDEFGVLLPGCDADAATEVAAQITAILEEPFCVRGLNLHVEASIGVASFPAHAGDVEALVSRADVAMYLAKESRTGWEVYAAGRDSHSRDRIELLGELRRAIEQRELELHYQPKIDLRSDVVEGVEALVRWRHPERGLLGPAEFLPLAERTTLMRPLTLLVLETALQQCSRWRDEGLDLSVAVNLSVPNLLDLGLPYDVLELLRRWNVPPERLTLEVTENVILANPGRIIGVLQALRKIGVVLSLDDFGTGASAMAHLKHLPIDELKIDRSFVIAMGEAAADAVIVRSTTELAQRLRLRVVAEGVETARVLDQLERLGADVAQGYFLQPPAPAAEIGRWLEGRQARLSAWKVDSEVSSAIPRS